MDILLWILSILLFIGGIGAAMRSQIIWAIILLAGAVILFPPFGIVT